jgi:hypothetical protein
MASKQYEMVKAEKKRVADRAKAQSTSDKTRPVQKTIDGGLVTPKSVELIRVAEKEKLK